MATNSANDTNDTEKQKAEEFDLASLFVGPANLMTGVLGLADSGRKTVSGVMETIASLQRAAKALEALVTRIDKMVAEIEAPMKVLAPELEKATQRLVRVSEAFEAPLDRLIPGLEGAISSLDRVSLSQLPETLEAVQRQIMSVLDVVRDIPRGFGGIGELVGRGLSDLGIGRAKPENQTKLKAVVEAPPAKKAAPLEAPTKAAPTKAASKSALKKAAAKKSATKKSVAKKSTAK
jgi:hypothetical protein